jgi:hypothetical protein
MKRKTPPPLVLGDLLPNVVLKSPDKVPCRIDRIENNHVHMTVLHDWKVDGEQEIAVPVDQVLAQWTLAKSKRRKAA